MAPHDTFASHPTTARGRSRVGIRLGDESFDFQGPEAIVERSLEQWLDRLDRRARQLGLPPLLEVDLGARGLVNTADVPEPPTAPARPSFVDWYRNRLVHPEGKRGVVQDHVLLIVYHVTHVLGAPSATANDLRSGFDALGMKQPNMPVLVYGLKQKGLLQAGDAYASYVLSAAGRYYIEERYSLVRH